MSEEKVELVRRIHELLDDQIWTSDLIADDVEYVNPPYAVEPGVRYGRESFRVVRDTWEDFRFDVDRLVDAGGDVVVALGRYSASGPASGISMTGDHGYVWTIRDGRAVRSNGSSRTRRRSRPRASRVRLAQWRLSPTRAWRT